MTKKILGPLSRVEGDLEIELKLENEVISEAKIKSTMYRGFEEMMPGRNVEDALILTPRICGICSISQSVATSKALADSCNMEVAPNGELVTNILHATEVITDLFTHYYLFFMPDFVHTNYEKKHWFSNVKSRFEPVKGSQYGSALKARAKFLHIMGVLGGKWPHTMAIQPGGSTKSVGLSETLQLRNSVAEFSQFISKELFGCSIEQFANLSSLIQLQQLYENADYHRSADLGYFHLLAHELNLTSVGQHTGSYLSYGGYSGPINSGTYGDMEKPLNPDSIIESIHSSFYSGSEKTPDLANHRPDLDKPDAYSWSKAPRYKKEVMEVGAFSRSLISGSSLAQDLMVENSATVYTRVMMGMQEMAQLILKIDQWITEIQQSQPFINNQPLPAEGRGVGLTEAARGSLGHWLSYQGGKINHYQIIAPTTWNFSPRDQNDQPGALEQALIGINMADSPQQVQHVIRSFDPCMQCTVH